MLNINGINFRLIDTAGIREATDAIEKIGVERTMEKIEQSALLVYVYDAAQITRDELNGDIESLQRPGVTMLAVANKADLLTSEQLETLSQSHTLVISAKERRILMNSNQNIPCCSKRPVRRK